MKFISTSTTVRTILFALLGAALLFGCGGSSDSTPSPPSAPTGVMAIPGDGQVTISWSPAAGATSYNIYWRSTATWYETINDATSPYVHVNQTNGTTYYYRVTAINAAGESGESVEVFAMPRVIVKISDTQADTYFGDSVSISGAYAIVGGRGNDSQGIDAGVAYIYHPTGPDTWGGTTKWATVPQANDHFGYSVSISGDYAIVGTDIGLGFAYIFRRTGTWTWDYGTKLLPPDQAGNFGISVSISGDYAIVGAPGRSPQAAYIFHRTGTNSWDGGTKIVPPDVDGNWFGSSVSISGNYAIVGAWQDDDGGTSAGAAYIFQRTGTNTWDSGIKIVSPDPEGFDYFGKSVSISGDYAIVGCQWDDAGGSYGGAAFIFHRTGATMINEWDGGTKITAPDAQVNDQFGLSVSISGDYAIVGAPVEDGGPGDPLSNAGAAYMFHRTDINTWDSGTKIVAPDAQADDLFGHSVSISGDYYIVGANQSNAPGAAGAAYIWRGQ